MRFGIGKVLFEIVPRQNCRAYRTKVLLVRICRDRRLTSKVAAKKLSSRSSRQDHQQTCDRPHLFRGFGLQKAAAHLFTNSAKLICVFVATTCISSPRANSSLKKVEIAAALSITGDFQSFGEGSLEGIQLA